MKKTLLTFFFAIAATFAMAQTTAYSDNLIVTIDGESADPQETTIFVEQNTDGTYKLALNNFILGGDVLVGNIVLDGITTTEENGIKSFQTTQNIIITAGNEGNEEVWIGPFLGEIPVSLTGKMDAEKLYCTIDIEMMEQVINVVFGSDFATDENTSVIEYTDDLIVTIDGESADPQETTIFVEQNTDGTYKLALNNFILGEDVLVGNIVLDGITATEENGIKSFQTTQNIIITAGNEGNEEVWIGPFLGEIPVSLTGKMDAEKLYCTIDIEMMEQVINVVFGDENAVTSIENITIEKAANVIYDLTGRKVNEINAAGIYIVNGKKVLVK